MLKQQTYPALVETLDAPVPRKVEEGEAVKRQTAARGASGVRVERSGPGSEAVEIAR